MKEFWKKFLKLKETEKKNLRNGIENMVTDEILCAVQSMAELFDTPDARNAGNAIWKMLADEIFILNNFSPDRYSVRS